MQSPFTFLLAGGMDMVTPRIAVPAGRVMAGVNIEPAERGYRRTGGYERFSGLPKPSDATYLYVPFQLGTGAISAGDTVTGSISGATGIAGTTATVQSGSYLTSNAAGYITVVGITGAFLTGEYLVSSGTPLLKIASTPLERQAPTDVLDRAWLAAEMERRRALIQAPAGQGPIRGVWTYKGDVYCFRNNVGATAGVMWKATALGWSQVALGETVDFTAGSSEILEGGTLTRGGVTATIQRVVLVSGVWSGSAAGYIVISGRSGGSFGAGAATATGGGAATLSGAQSAITLPAGGKYRFANHNFGGAGYGERMYGVNGVGRAFEFDGATLVPIRAPLSANVDKPSHIGIFAEHLFLAYPGGGVLHSNLGNPREFSATEDAGEHNIGTDPTNVIANAQAALVFFGKGRITYLTGSSNDDWVLQTLTDSAGALPDSAAMMLEPFYVDDRGIRRLSATNTLGDWRMGTVSDLVSPFFDSKQRQGVAPAVALRVRSKDQYRLYLADGTGMAVYIGRKNPECLPFELPLVAYTACSGEDALGREVLFVGGADGMVYQMDIGPSFDGQEVLSWMRLHFVAPSGTHIDYRWDKVTLEIDGSAQNTIHVSAEYDYAGEESAPGSEDAFTVSGGGAFWDAGYWNQFVWDAPAQGLAEAYLDGYGSNCSLAIISKSTVEEPFTLSSARFLTTTRRQKR